MGDTLRTIAVLIVAVMVLGFVGAYALLFHGTPEGQLALGALLPIAGAIGTFFFQQSSQAFLGTQLAAHRQLTAAAIQAISASSGNGSTPAPATIPASSSPPPNSPPGSPAVPTSFPSGAGSSV